MGQGVSGVETDLAVHKYAGQIQLHLEAHVHVGTVDGGRPPECEAPVGNLVQTTPLRIRQLLVLCTSTRRYSELTSLHSSSPERIFAFSVHAEVPCRPILPGTYLSLLSTSKGGKSLKELYIIFVR